MIWDTHVEVVKLEGRGWPEIVSTVRPIHLLGRRTRHSTLQADPSAPRRSVWSLRAGLWRRGSSGGARGFSRATVRRSVIALSIVLEAILHQLTEHHRAPQHPHDRRRRWVRYERAGALVRNDVMTR